MHIVKKLCKIKQFMKHLNDSTIHSSSHALDGTISYDKLKWISESSEAQVKGL